MIDNIFAFFDDALKQAATPSKSGDMENYMKNIQPFLGVQKPKRSKIYKDFKHKFGKYWRKDMTNLEFREIIRKIWEQPYREYRYTALYLIEYSKKFIIFENLEFFRQLIIEGNWWDTTDTTAQNVIGMILRENKDMMDEIIINWSTSDNLWIRRSAIISQLKFKENTDRKLLTKIIENTMSEDEFFIQKAIGWSLREFSKTDKIWVKDFIAAHESNLSRLAIREGSKYI